MEGYDILVKDMVVGEVRRYGRNPEEQHIGNMITDAGIFDFDRSKVDFYMIESGLYGDWMLTYGTAEQEIRHELFLFSDHLYDVKIDRSLTEPEDETAIMELFVAELLPEFS